MPKKVYTQEHHRRSWETWYETRNWSAVARVLGSGYTTPQRWSEPDYDCPFNCPYHGYEQLAEERNTALQARLDLLNEGVHDPVQHELAMRGAIKETRLKGARAGKNGPVMSRVVSDLERMKQWEFLYAKIYYDATGVAVAYEQLRADIGEDRETLKEMYRKGLHATSMEGAVRMLKMCQEQIDKLQGADRTAKQIQTQEEEEQQALTIQDLRQIRDRFKNTPPQRMNTMLSVMRAEDEKPTSATG